MCYRSKSHKVSGAKGLYLCWKSDYWTGMVLRRYLERRTCRRWRPD